MATRVGLVQRHSLASIWFSVIPFMTFLGGWSWGNPTSLKEKVTSFSFSHVNLQAIERLEA